MNDLRTGLVTDQSVTSLVTDQFVTHNLKILCHINYERSLWPVWSLTSLWPVWSLTSWWPMWSLTSLWPVWSLTSWWPVWSLTSRWPVMMMKYHVCSWSVRAPVDVLGPFLNCKTSPGSTLNEHISSVGRWVCPNLFQKCVRSWSGRGPVAVLRVVPKLQNLSCVDSGRAYFIRGSVGQT